MVKDLKAQTGKPLVVVLVEGRTRLLRGLPDVADAVVHAMLPGPFGGEAVAGVLLGEVNPSGRLPVSYPKRSGAALRTYYVKVWVGGVRMILRPVRACVCVIMGVDGLICSMHAQPTQKLMRTGDGQVHEPYGRLRDHRLPRRGEPWCSFQAVVICKHIE